MLSLTYEITTALSHTDELISPPYDIAIVTISYGRVTKSPVWDSMMSKKNMGWPFYAAVRMPHCNTLFVEIMETNKKNPSIFPICAYVFNPIFILIGRFVPQRTSVKVWKYMGKVGASCNDPENVWMRGFIFVTSERFTKLTGSWRCQQMETFFRITGRSCGEWGFILGKSHLNSAQGWLPAWYPTN